MVLIYFLGKGKGRGKGKGTPYYIIGCSRGVMRAKGLKTEKKKNGNYRRKKRWR